MPRKIPKEFKIDGNFDKLVGYEVIENAGDVTTIKLTYYLEEIVSNNKELLIKITD